MDDSSLIKLADRYEEIMSQQDVEKYKNPLSFDEMEEVAKRKHPAKDVVKKQLGKYSPKLDQAKYYNELATQLLENFIHEHKNLARFPLMLALKEEIAKVTGDTYYNFSQNMLQQAQVKFEYLLKLKGLLEQKKSGE